VQYGAAAVGAAALAPSLLLRDAQTQTANVLFILTDNQPASMIGCYGSPDIKTPHIDTWPRRARASRRPSPATAVLADARVADDGLIPSQHGIHDWIADNAWSIGRRLVRRAGIPHAAGHARQRGYYTAMIGKYTWASRGTRCGFPVLGQFPVWPYAEFLAQHDPRQRQGIQARRPHIVEHFAERGADFLTHYDGKKPFYLQLNFDGPYLLPRRTSARPESFYKEYLNKQWKAWPRTRFSEKLIKEIYGPDDPKDFNLHLFWDCLRMHQDPNRWRTARRKTRW